jgi:LPXTG-motif cell wall-anchored protein
MAAKQKLAFNQFAMAAGAAILALPIAFVAWRRTRKLRAA